MSMLLRSSARVAATMSLVLALFALVPTNASGATSAETTLEKAQAAFNGARFEEALLALRGQTARSQWPLAQRTRALGLLGQVHLRLQQEVPAERVFLELCRLDPAWEPDPMRFSPGDLEVFDRAREQARRERATADEAMAARQRSRLRRVGIKAGIASVAMTGSLRDALDRRAKEAGANSEWSRATRLSGGLFYSTGAAQRWSLQPELLIAHTGSTVELRGDGERLSEELLSTWIELPLLVRYRLSVAPRRALWAFAAPSLGMRIGTRGNVESSTATVEGNLDDAFTSTTTRLGLGMQVRLGGDSGSLWLDARWFTGLGAEFEPSGGAGKLSEHGFALFAGVKR